MFWSGFILISLVPVNSSVLQGTELDQTLCIWGWSWSLFFIPSYFMIIHLFHFRQKTGRRREDEFEGGKAEDVCLLQIEAERLAVWRASRPVASGSDNSCFLLLFFRPINTSQDSVRMGRGSVTFSNMVDMMGISGEDGETEDCDERVPLLCPGSRFS